MPRSRTSSPAHPILGDAKAQFQGFADTILQSGTGDNQADRVFADTRTLAASASEDLDLAGGSLVDTLGVPLTFAKVNRTYDAMARAQRLCNALEVDRQPGSSRRRNDLPRTIAR